jgi:hypothetical protein
MVIKSKEAARKDYAPKSAEGYHTLDQNLIGTDHLWRSGFRRTRTSMPTCA